MKIVPAFMAVHSTTDLVCIAIAKKVRAGGITAMKIAVRQSIIAMEERLSRSEPPISPICLASIAKMLKFMATHAQ